VLSRVLHDWEESQITPLLSKIWKKLPKAGALLVSEQVIDEDGTGPVEYLMQSLNMLVQMGGRERKLSEYEAMLTAAGFSSVQFKKTDKSLDAILAIK